MNARQFTLWLAVSLALFALVATRTRMAAGQPIHSAPVTAQSQHP